MNIKKISLGLLGATALGVGILFAADHIDAPAVASTSSDITDFYAFQSPNNNANLVFIANLQGLLSPSATANASFDEQVMVEFNIDNTGDFIEDLVIQAVVENGVVKIYGPIAPTAPGKTSVVESSAFMVDANVTAYGNSANIGTASGMKVFAGPRDDPFFMDFAQYGEIIAGNATSFNSPGSDTFAGTNVMSIVVEVPKSDLGTAATLNTWVESKRKN